MATDMTASAGAARRPNIVFIMADQLGARFVNCYGSGVDSSPTLDELARKGMRFNACYASWPVCAPNRACMLTGRSPAVHGITSNNLVLTADNPTYAHVLRRCGYRVGGFGKFHVTPMQQPVPRSLDYLGFDEVVVTEDPRLGPYLDWIEAEHPEQYEVALSLVWHPAYVAAYGPDGRDLRPLREAAREKHLAPRVRESGWGHMFRSPIPKELHHSTFITNGAIDFMERHVRQFPGRPFLCHVSYVDPHDPYDPPAPYDSMFDPSDMPAPLPAAWKEAGPDLLWQAASQYGIDRLDAAAIRQARAFYHGSIRLMDDQIARLVRFLVERGLWDNTILVFTTDHGDMMLDHGLITKGRKHYDSGIRCPLIVAGGGIRPGATERLTCALDFMPTFLEWAGAPVELTPPLEGRSFAGVCGGEEERDPWPDVTVEVSMVRSIITDDGWRLTVFDEPGHGQMHNLRDDPGEQQNLFHDTAFAGKRAELHHRFSRAYMRPVKTYQFRNLPVQDGRPHAEVLGVRAFDRPLDLDPVPLERPAGPKEARP